MEELSATTTVLFMGLFYLWLWAEHTSTRTSW